MHTSMIYDVKFEVQDQQVKHFKSSFLSSLTTVTYGALKFSIISPTTQRLPPKQALPRTSIVSILNYISFNHRMHHLEFQR